MLLSVAVDCKRIIKTKFNIILLLGQTRFIIFLFHFSPSVIQIKMNRVDV